MTTFRPARSSAQPAIDRRAAAGRRRQLIGLTPLIDVVFILLIFFMLASSFLDWRTIALDVPPAPSMGANNDDTILVELGEDGLHMAGAAVTLTDALAEIAGRSAANADLHVLLKPVGGVPLQRVVELLDRMAAAGIGGVSLIRNR